MTNSTLIPRKSTYQPPSRRRPVLLNFLSTLAENYSSILEHRSLHRTLLTAWAERNNLFTVYSKDPKKLQTISLAAVVAKRESPFLYLTWSSSMLIFLRNFFSVHKPPSRTQEMKHKTHLFPIFQLDCLQRRKTCTVYIKQVPIYERSRSHLFFTTTTRFRGLSHSTQTRY